MSYIKQTFIFTFILSIFSTHAYSEDLNLRSKDFWSRVYSSVYLESDGDPNVSLETVQPLHQKGANTLFIQPHAAYEDDSWTLNIGLGYRYMMSNQKWLLGTNFWFDTTTKYHHKRWGAGLEAIGQHLTFRANYYDGVTDWKTISTSGTSRVEERALDGFDTEVEGPIPYMPWMRLGLSYYRWDMITAGADDLSGFKGRLVADISPRLRLEAGYKIDNYDDAAFAKLSWALGQAREVEHSATTTGWVSNNRFKPRDLKRHTLARVKREHRIMVERRTVNGLAFSGISVARGS